MLGVMSAAIIGPAMPDIADHFRDAPHAELFTKLLLTMPALMIAICAPFTGLVIDRFGRLRTLYAAIVLYGAAGTAGFWLNDLTALLVSRALLGMAIAATWTTLTALATDHFRDNERTRFFSMQNSSTAFGSVVMVGLAGLVAEIGWRLPFLIYALGWLCMLPVMLSLREPARHANTGPSGGTDWPTSLVRRIAAVYLVTFFAVAMFYLIIVQVPFLIRSIGIVSPALIGLAVAVSSAFSGVSGLAYPRLRQLLGYAGVYALSFVLMALGYGLIALLPTYAAILVGLVLAGLGVGLFFPNSALLVMSLAPAHGRGRVSGGLTASVFLGQFSSPILIQPIVAAGGLVAGFGAAAIALVVVAGVCAMVSRSAVHRATVNRATASRR